MNPAETLKDTMVAAANAGDSAAVERIAPLWKSAVEAQKAELDIAEAAARQQTEKVRFWVPIIASVISSVALVATLGFQVYQFREQARTNAQTLEDAAWRDVLNRAKNIRNPDSAFALAMMTPFLDSERYAMAARNVSAAMLGHMADPDSFDTLFPQILERTDPGNMKDIVRIAATLNRVYQDMPNTKNLEPQRNGVSKNMTTAAEALRVLLKRRPASSMTDLSSVQFGTIDLSAVSFSNTRLVEAIFFRCNVKDATFADIEDFTDSDWRATAWWRAKFVDPRLVDYLEKNYPFDAEQDYGWGYQASQNDFVEAVRSLKSRTPNI